MLQLGGRGQSIQQWNDLKILAPKNWVAPKSASTTDDVFPIHRLVKALALHSHPEAGDLLYNSTLRKLDTSWRLKQVAETFVSENARIRHPEEVILIGRAGSSTGESSPSVLSISKKENNEKIPVKPTINQETFIRVIIPIQPSRP